MWRGRRRPRKPIVPAWRACLSAACGATTLSCRTTRADTTKRVRSANNIFGVLFLKIILKRLKLKKLPWQLVCQAFDRAHDEEVILPCALKLTKQGKKCFLSSKFFPHSTYNMWYFMLSFEIFFIFIGLINFISNISLIKPNLNCK
jgi:hypothetical protein